MSNSTRALDGLATDAVQELWERLERGNLKEDLVGNVIVDLKSKKLARNPKGWQSAHGSFDNCTVAVVYDDRSIVIRVAGCNDDELEIRKPGSSAYHSPHSYTFWALRGYFVEVGLLTQDQVIEQEAVLRKAHEESSRKFHEAADRETYERLKLKFEGVQNDQL